MADEFFEEKKIQTLELVEMNYRVDKLIENYDTTKIDAIVNTNQSTQVHDDVEFFVVDIMIL